MYHDPSNNTCKTSRYMNDFDWWKWLPLTFYKLIFNSKNKIDINSFIDFQYKKTRLTEIIHRFLIHEQDMQDWHRYSTDFKFINKIDIHFSLILNLWTKLLHNFYQPSKNESKNYLHETFLLNNITCKKLLVHNYGLFYILLLRQFSTCSCC